MGSGTATPTQTTTGDILFGNKKKGIDESYLPGGKDFYEAFMKQYKEGLPKDISDIYTKQGKAQIGSQLAEGQQELLESLTGSGSGVPIDALIGGNTRLQNNANKSMSNLSDTLAMRNYGAKQDAFSNYANLIGLATGQGASNNAFNMQKYQIDKDKEFSWGDALGGLLGAGGSVASAGITRKK